MIYCSMRAIVIYTAYGVPPGKTAKALLFNTTHKDLAEDEKTSVKNYLTKKPTMDELGLFD